MISVSPAELVTGTIKGTTTPDLMAAIEAKLREAEASREWTDADEALLAAWRWARGEAGMSPKWEWWSMLAGEDEYQFLGTSRDDVLAQARVQHPDQVIMIVEARDWSDDIRPEHSLFAQFRNQERVAP